MAETTRYYPTQILMGLLMVALQSTVLAKLGGVDFMVALVLFISLQRAVLAGAVLVFCLGALLDLASSSPLGLHSAMYLIFYYSANIIHRRLLLEHPFQQMIVALAGLLLVHLPVNIHYGGPSPDLRLWLALAFSVALTPVALRLFAALERIQARLLKPLTAPRP